MKRFLVRLVCGEPHYTYVDLTYVWAEDEYDAKMGASSGDCVVIDATVVGE